MKYAMTLQNKVIGIVPEQDTEPHWPPSPSKKTIKAVACDDSVRIGMVYCPETGTFTVPVIVKPEEEVDPVMEKLDSIEAKIQTNEDLQTFYDEIVKEVGL